MRAANPKRSTRAALLLATLVGGLQTASQAGTVVFDKGWNDPNKERSLQGPNYAIGVSDGKQAGKNLFYSFKSFNLDKGDAATFDVRQASINNVISRVTGGPSTINGQIAMIADAGSRPAFFFVNPAGITFGEGASINVPGTFHATTASYIKFKEGSPFDIGTSDVSSLTYDPVAFGFLKGGGGALNIKGASFSISEMSFTASNINAIGSLFEGRIFRFAAVGSSELDLSIYEPWSKVPVSNRGLLFFENSKIKQPYSIDMYVPHTTPGGTSFDMLANSIHITDGSEFNFINRIISTIDSVEENNFLFHSESFDIAKSKILTSSYDSLKARLIFDLSGSFYCEDCHIKSEISPKSGGGSGWYIPDIQFSATTFRMREGEITTRAIVESGSSQGGGINIESTGDINLIDKSTINTGGYHNNNPGPIYIKGRNIVIDTSTIASDSAVHSHDLEGTSGAITIHAEESLILASGSKISSSSNARSGQSGAIKLQAKYVSLSGASLISSQVLAIGSPKTEANRGTGGIYISAQDSLGISGGSRLSSTTASLSGGDATDITVSAPSIDIYGAGSGISAGSSQAVKGDGEWWPGNIDPKAPPNGNVGNIYISSSGGFKLRDGAFISNESISKVSDPSKYTPSSIHINAQNVEILNNSSISSSSSGNIGAGNIFVSYSNTMTIDPSGIYTSATGANGGSISIKGGQSLVLQDAVISTSVAGTSAPNAASGGNISIAVPTIVMKGAGIEANTSAKGGAGGQINIQTDSLVASGNALFIGGSPSGTKRAGANYIQADAPNGVSGTVSVSSPRLDIAGILRSLKTVAPVRGDLGRTACNLGTGSHFALAGRGAMPESATDYLRVAGAPITTATSPIAPFAVSSTFSSMDLTFSPQFAAGCAL